jgi:hypothetical protein
MLIVKGNSIIQNRHGFQGQVIEPSRKELCQFRLDVLKDGLIVSVRRNTLEEEIGASQRLIAGGWLTGSEGLLESFPISRNQL